MNQYIKFIRHVLWACFFVTFLGLLVHYIVGWNQYVLGWLWGLQIPGVRAESLLISVVLIQPVLYIVFWRLSK